MRLRTKWIAIVVATLSGWVSAQTTSVGIPTANFNFVSAAQLKNEWCWAASVQMVLNWYNIPITQSDVVDRIYGKPVDEAASEDAIAVALSGAELDRDHQKVLVRAKRIRGAPPTQLLVEELSQQHPVLITVRSSQTTLHAVVLTSAEYERTAQGHIHVTSLTLRDPNPNIKGRRTASAIRIADDELGRFARTIISYYMVSVKRAEEAKAPLRAGLRNP